MLEMLIKIIHNFKAQTLTYQSSFKSFKYNQSSYDYLFGFSILNVRYSKSIL